MSEKADNTLPQVRPEGRVPFVTRALADFNGDGSANPPAAISSQANPAFSVSMLARRKWWIFGVFFLVAAATIPSIWLFSVPTYEASALVQVSARVPRIVFNTENNGIVPLYTAFMNTQVSRIKSRKVLERTLDDSEVRATLWFRETPRTIETVLGVAPPSKMERLRDALVVRNRRRTELIHVAFTALHPQDAKVIVDVVVDEYKKLSDEDLAQHEALVFETLRQERRTLVNEIDGLVEIMGDLSKRVGTFDPDIVRSQLALQVSSLETQRESLDRAHQITLWEIEHLSGDDGAERMAAIEPIPEPVFRNDPEWRKLKRELQGANYALEIALQQYGESHPRIKELSAGIDHAQGLLREREAELADPGTTALRPLITGVDGTTVTVQPQATELLAKRQEREIDLLDERIAELKTNQDRKGELAKRLAKYDEQLQQKRQLYKAVHDRLTALEMEEKAPGRISVADYAVAPTRPAQDRRILLTLVALCGALLAGVATGYLRATMDTRICEASEVTHALTAPFLGQLPLMPGDADLMGDGAPLVTECIRMVRTALLERLDRTNRNVVLITSATSQDGKSTVAALLSRSLAQIGKRTLLVEADLRRPSLGRRLDLASDLGLAAVLSGEADDRKAILGTSVPNLDVMLAGNGSHAPNPEALANGVLGKCLDRWRKTYDFILLDAPPVLPVADARILAGQADGTILVLRASHTRRGEVMQAFADLSAAGGSLLGTVLVGTKFGSQYGYYGGYESDYRSEHMLESKS